MKNTDICTYCGPVSGPRYCAVKNANTGNTCTRPGGHTGNHVACGFIEHNIISWKQEKENNKP